MTSPICEAEWAFDVDFEVNCVLPPDHTGDHVGHREGNGSVPATITWPGPCTCVEVRLLGQRDPQTIPGSHLCPIHPPEEPA